MRRNLLRIVFMGLSLLLLPHPAGAVGLEFAIGGWMQDPSGTLGCKPSSEDDLLDVQENLNYEEDLHVAVRAAVDMPYLIPSIYLMATPVEYYAPGSSEDGFKFGDSTFEPGSFHSELDSNNVDIGLYYGFPFLRATTFHRLNFDVGLNLRLFDYDLRLSQSESKQTEEQSGTIPIPMVFLAIQFRPIERLSLEAEGRGISYSGNEVYSLIGRLEYKFFGPLFIAGGYRHDQTKLDEDDLQTDIVISGPFLELGISFFEFD
jgi:outer membrane protein